LSTKVIPEGSAPDSERAGTGPEVVTVKEKGAATRDVAEAALVIEVAPVPLKTSEAPLARLVQVDWAPP
jgi:hypothetical protein